MTPAPEPVPAARLGGVLLALIVGQTRSACARWPGCAWPRRWTRWVEAPAPGAWACCWRLFAVAPVLLALRGRPHGRPLGLPPAAAHGDRLTVAGLLLAAGLDPGRRAAGASRCCARGAIAAGAGANVGLIVVAAHRRAARAQRRRTRARVQLARHRAVVFQRDRPGGGRAADRRAPVSASAYRAAAAAALRRPVERAPCRRRRPPPPRTAPPRPAWDLLREPGMKRLLLVQLAAVDLLGRAQLCGADPRPRARLQRHDHRPGAGHLHAVGDAGARW